MEKAKFKIKGMYRQSGATLIEEKLKNLPGVIQAKISYESGKGVIVYDENAIEETKIQREIESVGEYSVEKIEEKEEESSNNDPLPRKEEKFQSSPETSGYLKFLTSLVILSFGLSIASLI